MNQTRNTYQLNSSWNAPYTFSGKEKDAETGYGYVKKLRFFSSLAFGNEKQVFHYAHCLRRLGARYYDSGLSVWLSVDPLSDKYPTLSPYTYCANNPIMMVDPDGRSFMIGTFLYIKGEACPNEMKDEKLKTIWKTMNILYGTKVGRIVIDEMDVEGHIFKISAGKTKDQKDGTAIYLTNGKNNGGTIYLNDNVSNALVLAHELFHGYQDFYKQKGRSIHKEVEANLFTFLVGEELKKSWTALYKRSSCSSSSGLSYQAAFNHFSLNPYNEMTSNDFDTNFKTLVNGFKAHAFVNYNGDYNNDVLGIGSRNLIKQFFNVK